MRLLTIIICIAVPMLMRGDELSRLLETVEKNNLELKAMREEMKASGYDIQEQNRLDNTSVEYSPFFRRGADGIASSELIVTQEFDFPTLYAARSKAGKSQMSYIGRQYDVAGRDLMLTVAENYLSLVRINRVRRSLGDQLMDAEKLLKLSEKKMENGMITSVELNRVKLQIMDLKRSLLDNESEAIAVKSELNRLNGYEELDCAALDYPGWGVDAGEDVDLDAKVVAAASGVEAAKREESVAKQSWVPKLTLGYRRNTELEEASNGFVVGASFPLFTTSAKVKASKARRAAAEVNMENVRLQVASEFETARQELQIIKRSMQEYNTALIDDTQRLLMKSVELGQMTLTDYYTELISLNETKMSYIDLEYEYYRRLCILYRNRLSTTIN